MFSFCRFRRRRGQRTVTDNQTDSAETDQTDRLVVDIELSTRRRPTGIHYKLKMAGPTKQDDRSNIVSKNIYNTVKKTNKIFGTLPSVNSNMFINI